MKSKQQRRVEQTVVLTLKPNLGRDVSRGAHTRDVEQYWRLT